MTRTFDSGATRDTDDGKLDYEGFMSPRVVVAFAKYMHHNRYLPDGSFRDSDNWQKGIPLDAYMKSMFRHFMEVWEEHRCYTRQSVDDYEKSLVALLALKFNVDGYIHEVLGKTGGDIVERALANFDVHPKTKGVSAIADAKYLDAVS